ncbi:MAG: ornithine carbamoyltransferase [Deltaproteobacteria bacterium]|nr:ornithine carbamoyltransferase [Deltaproteobacteria bacterium]
MNLLTISELSKAEIDALVERAIELKAMRAEGTPHKVLDGKTLGLIFEKASTRTRVSFEAGMNQLGGGSVFLSQEASQIGRGEPVKDTARVMSRYVDAVVIRTFGHGIIEEFAEYADVPVINGLTDMHHPCQVLADVMTMVEEKGSYDGLKVAWIGDGNNMANSWIEVATILGFDLSIACPEGYCPEEVITAEAGGNVKVCTTVEAAVEGADVLNTDVWASMGQEEEQKIRIEAFKGYQINAEMLRLAKSDAMVMHCLPAHRGEEITDEVIEGKNSVVWNQAENRLHIQKAILERLIK